MNLIHQLRAREGMLAVSAGALLWGTNGVIVHDVAARSGLSSVSIGCYRLLFAAAVLLVGFARPTFRLWRRSSGQQRWLLLVSGASLGGYQALYFAAIGNVGVSLSTLVSIGVAPLAITVGTAAVARTLPSTRSLLILVLGLTGLALVSLPGHAAAGPHPVLGLLEAIGSGLGYAGSTVVNRRLADTEMPMTLTTLACVFGAVTLLPVAASSGLGFHADLVTVSSLGYMGIIATAVAYGLFFHGLRSTSSEVAAVLTLLEPLTATLLAVALLRETLTGLALVGGLLMMVAIAALYLRRPDPVHDPDRAPATIVG
jgi:drug/metabolite transporter (DMT)-like permease